MGAVWPEGLPRYPLRAGYTGARPNLLLRSAMDTGPAKVRRRGNAKPRTMSASYLLDDGELALLDEFVSVTLADGARAFDWPHPQLRREVRARLVPASEEALYEWSLYEDTLYWQVTLSLEVWPDAPLS